MKSLKRMLLLTLSMMLSLGALCDAMAEVTIVTPEMYDQTGTLPIYRAEARSLFDAVDLEWFNQSGEAIYENLSRRARYDHFVFPDGAELNIDIYYLDYQEYDGDMTLTHVDDPDNPSTFPRPSLDCEIGSLASGAHFSAQWDEEAAPAVLDKTELTGITLSQARAVAEELLAKLGSGDFECVYALDMSVKRIHELGAAEMESRKERLQQSDDWWDFSLATEENEGFYLDYEKKLCGADVRDLSIAASAYVTANGLCSFVLRDEYAVGELAETPERLLDADEMAAIFEAGNARREKDGFHEPTLTGLRLMYMPMRAQNRAEGMVYAPVWYATYTFMDGGERDGWAWYSAVDGTLVEDCYS